MARKVRIAAIGGVVVAALVAAILGGAYYAVQQVRPFYQQALQIEPEILERGSRELESLYALEGLELADERRDTTG